MRAEPAAVGLFRISAGSQSVKLGLAQLIVRSVPEFATGPFDAANPTIWLPARSIIS